jgi:hypothetical protein
MLTKRKKVTEKKRNQRNRRLLILQPEKYRQTVLNPDRTPTLHTRAEFGLAYYTECFFIGTTANTTNYSWIFNIASFVYNKLNVNPSFNSGTPRHFRISDLPLQLAKAANQFRHLFYYYKEILFRFIGWGWRRGGRLSVPPRSRSPPISIFTSSIISSLGTSTGTGGRGGGGGVSICRVWIISSISTISCSSILRLQTLISSINELRLIIQR